MSDDQIDEPTMTEEGATPEGPGEDVVDDVVHDVPEVDAEDDAEDDAEVDADEGAEVDADEGAEVDADEGAEVDADEGADPVQADAVTEPDEGEGDEGDESTEGRPSRVERLEGEGDIAADYLEELLDIADLDGDLDMDVEADRAVVSIVGADLSQLVGRDGEVLEALQELTRLAVYRETGERSRLMLDVSGYRAGRRQELVALAADAIARVKESGERLPLQPMSAFERKVVHDEVTASGLVSESEGTEPRRFVVILPS